LGKKVNNIIVYIGIFIIGWILALVVNYFSDVLPFTRTISKATCQKCEQVFPVLPYIALQACPNCGEKRSIRTWITQLAFPLALIWFYCYAPVRIGFWLGALLLVYLLVIAIIDLEYRVVLYQTTVAGVVIGLGLGIYLHGLLITIYGGLAGFSVMLALYYLGIGFARFMARLRSQTDVGVALGFGDVTLAGVLGLILGWPGILAGLLLAIILGGLASGIYLITLVILKRYQLFSAIPYAPFLVLSTILLLYRP
jgi:prepilin signal peptidase PulO-like enzyme (type II secretory pathway)